MRYNVPGHQSGLYLLCIVLEPSLDPSSTLVEGGKLPLCDVKRPTLFRWPKETGWKDLKLRAWVPIALFTHSILPPAFPKPFCHIWISVTPNIQKWRILTFFSNIKFGQHEFVKLAKPLYDSICLHWNLLLT